MKTEVVYGSCEQCLPHDSVRLELSDIGQDRWAICPNGHMTRIGPSEYSMRHEPVYREFTHDLMPELGARMNVHGRRMEVTGISRDFTYSRDTVTARLQPV